MSGRGDSGYGRGVRSFLPALVRVLPVVLVGYLVFSGIRGFLFERYLVPTSSMEPTLHGDPRDGDLVLVDKTAFWRHPPEPWDLVVVRHREQAGEQFLVKRMVAEGPLHVGIDRGDLFTGSGPNQLQRVVKSPLAARRLRQTWDEFPAHSATASFLQPAVGLWEATPERIRCSAGATAIDELVAEATAARRTERARGEQPDPYLPRHLSLRESISMTFLDCHGQRRGRAYEDQDVGYELTLVPDAGMTALHFVLEHERRYVSVGWTAAGTGRVHVDGVAVGAELQGPPLVAATPLRVEFGYLDGHVFLLLDDQLVLHAPQALEPVGPETNTLPRLPPRLPSLLHFGVAGGSVDVTRWRVFHDIYYDQPGNPLVGPAEPVRLEAGQIYLLGDNTAESRDSRSLGPFTDRDLVGRPLAVLAPWSRLQLLYP